MSRHQRFPVTGPSNGSWGNSSSCLCIGVRVLRLGNQQLRAIKGSVLVRRIFHPVMFLFPWWTFTGCTDGAFSCSAAYRAAASSGLLLLLLKKRSKRHAAPDFLWHLRANSSSAFLLPLSEPQAALSFLWNTNRNCESRSGASSCDCNASQTFHNNSQLEKVPLISNHTDSLYKRRCEGNQPEIHFLIITITPQCLFLLWKPWLHQKWTKSTFSVLWSTGPLRLALILSRALRNVSPLSGLNMTKPMSLETSIFMFIVPLCHVLQQKYIYRHQSF